MKKQNVVLKFGIGLVLGIGAFIVAPQTAHASKPCDSSPKDWTTCPVVDPQLVVMTFSDLRITYGCFDTNCDHVYDHTFKIEDTHRDFSYNPPGGGTSAGQPPPIPVVCDSYHYIKEGKC